jgi:hypothetical protein
VLISAREASRLLTRDGVSRRAALRVLGSGLVGDPVRTSSVVLYDQALVEELAARPSVHWREAAAWCPSGFFVSRRAFPATRSRADQMTALTGGWGSISPWEWVTAGLRLKQHGALPFVATVGGLVVLGADIVELRGLSQLVLEEPGPWFDGVAGSWFPTGPGRPWVLHLGTLRPEQPAT